MERAIVPRSLMGGAAAAFLLFGCLAWPHAAWASLRLCMKDGSFQMVSTYEVHGDRVRYYSVERSEWEEVPTSQVDFPATRRVQEEEKAEAKKKVEEAKEIEQQRFERPAQQGLEVAPGIHLPTEDGIYTVEGLRLVRLLESAGEMVTDKKRAAAVLAVPLPLLKARSLLVLEGPRAVVRISTRQPTFYVQSADGLGTRLDLLRVKPGKASRVVEQVEAGRAGIGKTAEQHTTVSVTRTQISPTLCKLVPAEPLQPGEYTWGELVQSRYADLWDFGLDTSRDWK